MHSLSLPVLPEPGRTPGQKDDRPKLLEAHQPIFRELQAVGLGQL
jgi:hypothetical protein